MEFEDYEDFYRRLRKLRVVRNADEFSVNFFGASPSTYSVLKARHCLPSFAGQVTLIHKLQTMVRAKTEEGATHAILNRMLFKIREDLTRRAQCRLERTWQKERPEDLAGAIT